MTGAVVGLMTLLLALALGLLIWTAYGVFSTQKASVQTLAITELKLDEAFQDYGPEAAEGHRILREGIKNTIAEIWGGSNDEEAVFHRFGSASNRRSYFGSIRSRKSTIPMMRLRMAYAGCHLINARLRQKYSKLSVPPKSVMKFVESTRIMSPARFSLGGIQMRQLNSVFPAAVKGCGRSRSIG